MPTYEVTTPQGKFRVTAPEGATEDDILGELEAQIGPIGSQRPQESEPAPIPAPVVPQLTQEAAPTTAEGLAQSYLQGATFGFGDEAVSGMAALYHATQGRDMGEAYEAAVGRERERLEQFRESDPGKALTAEIVGAIPTAILTGGGSAPGASMLSQMGRGAAVGAGQGGVYGFGAGEGGVPERLANAAPAALLSAPLGAAAPPIAAGAGNVVRNLITSRAARQAGVSRPTFERTAYVMRGDESLTGEGARRIAAAGDEAMLAEAGPTASALLDVAIQKSGPAGREAAGAVAERSARAGSQLTRALDEALGAPQGVRETSRGISRSTAPARGDAYSEAFAQAIDYDSPKGDAVLSVLGRVPDNVMRSAIDDANALMRIEGVTAGGQLVARTDDAGRVVFDEMPNVMQLDALKQALDGIAEGAKGELGRATTMSRAYGKLAKDLRNALTDAVPAYRTALREGQNKIQQDQGLDLGRRLLSARTTMEEVSDFLEAIGENLPARQAVMQGVRSSIDDNVARVTRSMADGNMDAREGAKILKDLSSRANRTKLASVLGPEDAATLFDELDQAASAFELRARVAGNSQTFARQQMNQFLNETEQSGPLTNLARAEPVEAARHAVQGMTGQSPAQQRALTDEQMVELVRLLTGPRGNEIQQILRSLEQVPVRSQAAGAATTDLATRLLRGAPGAAVPLQQDIRRR